MATTLTHQSMTIQLTQQHTHITTTLPPQHDPEITPTLLHTLFLLEREGGGEYSEARLSWLGTIVWKFMSESIATLGT